jgi:HAMP domain-containing protein
MGIAYLVLAIALLALWVRVLRRTTRIEEMVSMM